MVEAIEQLTRALNQTLTLPSTSALRNEEMRLQVALTYSLMHVKGIPAPEAKASAERARLLIERAEGLGEPPEDTMLLFTVLTDLFAVEIAAFNGNAARERAAEILALAKKQGAKFPLMLGHALVGLSSALTGNLVESRVHLDQAIMLYDSVEHRSLYKRVWIIQDPRVSALYSRSLALWALGYPDAAHADAEQALSYARETGDPVSRINVLANIILVQLFSGYYGLAKAQSDELIMSAEEKGSISWKTAGMMIEPMF